MFIQENQRRPNSFRVVKLTMQETGSYNPMFSRPYQTYIDGESMRNITERINNNQGQSISGALVAGVASSIMTPTAYHQGEIAIPCGWSERRIRFLLEVAVMTSTGTEFIYYFQGYTNYLGVSGQGSIDPNMEFVINSFIRVNRIGYDTPAGVQMQDVITESAHIINGQIMQQGNGGSDVYSMRPQDIFTGIQSAYLAQGYNQMSQKDGYTDTRFSLGNDSVRSSRSNNLPSNYIAKVVDAYQTGRQLINFGQGDEDIYNRSRSLVHETSTQENVFIRQLSNVKGVPNATTFTIGDLTQIDPNLPHSGAVNYLSLGPTAQQQLHMAGQTAYWNDVDRETLVATILSNAVPAIMMELMIRQITFSATNHDSMGMTNVIIMKAGSLSSANLTSNFEIFKKRLEREVLFDLSYGNQELYSLTMAADLFGETMITIGINGKAPVTFTTPSFCDGLMVPVITGNKENFNSMVHDFEGLMKQIGRDTSTVGSSINNNV